MRPIQPQRRRSSAGFWLGLILILAVSLGGGFVALTMMGVNLLPWSDEQEDPFMVRIPINSRAIPAYSKVEREHLLNPTTGGLMFQKIPPQAVVGMSVSGIARSQTPVEGQIDGVKNEDGRVVFVVGDQEIPQSQVTDLGGALMNINSILGRVVRRDKRAGMGFREGTFFPKGTPEGIAGATPPGMKALTLDATKLTGIHSLNAGDTLDLVASIPMKDASSFQASSSGPLPGALLAGTSRESDSSERTEPVLLAQNAIMLKPVTVRNEASTTSSLTSGKRLVNEPKYEVAIAVTPDDIIPLQSALDRGLTITCVAASGQTADADPGDDTAGGSGQLMAPVTVRPIPAYAVVTREAFISPATRRIRYEPVSERQAYEMQVTLRIEEMLGAVVRHDIPAGSFVRQNDLLRSRQGYRNRPEPSQDSATPDDQSADTQATEWNPTGLKTGTAQDELPAGANVVGDRPAVTNFIPPGHTAVAVPWNRIYGSEHLQIDDHIDLLASYPLERSRNVVETEQQGDRNVVTKEYDEFVSRRTDRTWNESLGERGEPWFVATDAIVVGPVGFPPPAAAMRAIGTERSRQGAQNVSGPAILIAVDTRDLESIATVLNTPDVLLSVAFRIDPGQQANIPGFRQIAVAPVEIPVFSEFSDLHWKGLRRDITARMVAVDDPRFASAISIDEIDRYYGRVLKVAKTRFAAIHADDFLPKGATPGVAAGIGADHVVVSVISDQVQSLNRFEDNDEVTLLLTGSGDVPPNAVFHSIFPPGLGARVVVQSARILRAVSDISDTIALAIPVQDAAAFTAALFAHDAEDEGDKHHHRLIAVARHRIPNPAHPKPHGNDRRVVEDYLPLKASPQVYEVLGGTAKTHFFSNGGGILP